MLPHLKKAGSHCIGTGTFNAGALDRQRFIRICRVRHKWSKIVMSNFLHNGPQASWFGQLFGVEESNNYTAVQANFKINNDATMTSLANGETFRIGHFTTPTLNALRTRGVELLRAYHAERTEVSGDTELKYQHVVQGDVLPEHAQHPGAVFQAASQFNCLEFPSWQCLPEHGVTAYAHDHTQGPACALACAAGTVYRNYFADVDTHALGSALHSDASTATQTVLGQSKHRQINNLDLLQRALNNDNENYFSVLNGYVFAQHERDLARLSAVIAASQQRPAADPTAAAATSALDYESLKGLVKIGLQRDVGVDFTTRFRRANSSSGGGGVTSVTQAYCSALSCAYSGMQNTHWAPLARLVLEANYEATLWAAVIHHLEGRVAPSAATLGAVTCSSMELSSSSPLNATSCMGSSTDSPAGSTWEPWCCCVRPAISVCGTNTDSRMSLPSGERPVRCSQPPALVWEASPEQGPSRQCSHQVFLTFLGGGVFGNEPEWIADAIGRAIAVLAAHKAPIEVNIAHYRNINRQYVQLIDAAFERERRGIAR
jgi:hypothetical protein